MLDALHQLRERPSHLAVLVLCAAIVAIHQLIRWDWMIDDAAIVFAFARNWAAGDGLVVLPGGERVEGFSDPAWLALLALGEWLGASAMDTARPLSLALSVATVPLVWLTARRALPDHDGPGPLLAPIVLSLNAQFSLWAGSGLENALFCFLLSLGVQLTLMDMERDRFPVSSLAWLALSWTRPEGALYAGIGLVALAVGRWLGGHGLRGVASWLIAVIVPSLALEALRVWYFAWPLPNTAYAKLSNPQAIISWRIGGWIQLRDWADRLWHGWFAPVYVIGMVGASGRRAKLGLAGLGFVCVTLLWPPPDWLAQLWFWPELPDVPRWWLITRIVLMGAFAAGVLLLTIGRSGWQARLLAGGTVLAGMVFSVVVGGDWMGAYRWTSLFTPPLAVVLAVGITELADLAQRLHTRHSPWATAGWATAAFGIGLLIPPNLSQMRDHALYNNNPTPWVVLDRLEATRGLARRLGLTEPLVRLDMDMGGSMWWGVEQQFVDIAALIDVPLAHRRGAWKQKEIVREYVFDERRPQVAMLPQDWAKRTRLQEHEEWSAMVPLPLRCRVCMTMWIRRDLLLSDEPASETATPLGDQVTVEGVRIEAPWGAGRRATLEIPMTFPGDRDVRAIAFLSDGDRLATWDLALGNGILRPSEFEHDEVYRGFHTVALPEDLPPGTYDLGLVVLADDGTVLSAPDAQGPPRVATGELLLPGAVQVVTSDGLDAAAESTIAELIEAADDGRCADAEDAWVRARRLRPDVAVTDDPSAAPASAALAACFARAAEGLEPHEAATWLARSHRWDHRSAELARVGAPIGEALYDEGLAALDRGDAEAAFVAFQAVLTFQPWRAWARRHAEEARDQRLGATE